MLIPRAHFSARSCPPSPHVFDQTLAKSNCARDRHDDRHDEIRATGPVRLGRRSQTVGEEHAKADVEVPEHSSVARQGIGQQDITKLAILRFRETSDGDPLQGQEEPNPPRP